MKEVYENVRNIREDRDLKQKDVADCLKLSRTTYNHYELGHTSFTAEMIIDIAHFLNTTPNVLLNFNNATEITDPDLVKLCNVVQEENVDVDTLIKLIRISRNLRS